MRPNRARHCLLATITGFFFLICLAALYRASYNWTPSYVPYFNRPSDPSTNVYVEFGNALFRALEANSPQISPLEEIDYVGGLVFWKATNDTPRPDLVYMDSNKVATMRRAHEEFLQTTRQLEVPFKPGTAGIVSTAGGAYLPIFIVSLRMLRRTGCQLPVELFLRSREEHGSYLCDTLLPSLNARCVRLEDFLGERANTVERFQIKVFAMLFSSFESVLFLDADNFLVENPKDVFVQEPFLSSGLVTWPDFWASSASKYFYEIIGRPVPGMDLFASSESGQLLVSKFSHDKALMMAAYYNFYGPDYYYNLMTQDGPGWGDKESFIAGAQAVSAPFYQVKKCVDTIGYYEDDIYHGVAMVQYDPTQTSDVKDEKPRPFSVHHNYPKFDPVDLFSADGAATNRATGKGHRLLGEKDLTMERFGRDVEAELWEEIQYVACELADKFRHWRTVPGTSEHGSTCDQVKEYRTTVFDIP